MSKWWGWRVLRWLRTHSTTTCSPLLIVHSHKMWQALDLMILQVVSNWNGSVVLCSSCDHKQDALTWGQTGGICHGFTSCLSRQIPTKSGSVFIHVLTFEKISLYLKPVLEEYLKTNQNVKLPHLEVTVTLLPLSLILGEMRAPWKEKQIVKIRAWSRQTLKHSSGREKPRDLGLCLPLSTHDPAVGL